MKSSTPAARHAGSNSPGRPASATPFAPEALSALAKASACCAYASSVAAQADERRAGRSHPFDCLFGRRRFAIIDGFKTACREPFARELNAPSMPGFRPQRGEIDFRPRAAPLKESVGKIAQTLERLGEPNWREPALRRNKRLALRRANGDLDRPLGKIGVRADAGDQRLQSGDIVDQRRRAVGDLSLKGAVRQGRRADRLVLRSPETGPMPCRKAPGSAPRTRPRRRLGRRQIQDSIPAGG